MSDDVPAPPADPGPVPGAPTPPLRRPRKRFFVIGVVVAAALGVGLFTSLGSSSSGAPSAGDDVPAFSAPNVGSAGQAQVSVSPSSSGGRPTVLLFFGAWCPSCHTELPGLAAAVATQDKAGGPLSHVRVVGVDSLDSSTGAAAFAKQEGVTFPVAWDPDAHITTDQFSFTGDPYAVFVRADGTIDRIVRGAVLDGPGLTAAERALIPSGS
jgi:peroxiredoxin